MINQKTIDKIRNGCNAKFKERYRGGMEHPVEDYLIVAILQEFFKLLLEEKK